MTFNYWITHHFLFDVIFSNMYYLRHYKNIFSLNLEVKCYPSPFQGSEMSLFLLGNFFPHLIK